MAIRCLIVAACACLGLVVFSSARAQGSGAELPTPPAIANVENLLDAIEALDAELDTLTAGVVYQRVFSLQGDQHTRYGRLDYRADPARAFALSFDRMIVDQTVRDQDQTIVFDGEWLVEREVDEEGRRFTKRRIAAPGEDFDPFRVGNQTLIPLPIGQRKADILERYRAELLPPDVGVDANNPFLQGLIRTHQLRLTPLDANNEEERFREIRLWYARDTLLPQLSIAMHRNGDQSLVRLTRVRANEGVDPDRITVGVPEGEGWQVRVEDRFVGGPVIEADEEEGP